MMLSKTLKYSIGGLCLLMLIGFALFEIACRQTEACKCSAFSDSREAAIEEGFYIDAYRSLQQSTAIPNTKDTIWFDAAWIEHSWKMERRLGICLLEHKVKGDHYNFCVFFSTTALDINSYPFELKQLEQVNDPYYDPGSYSVNRFNFGMNAVRDTIKIVVEQKTNDKVPSNGFVDTIMFIKSTNGR